MADETMVDMRQDGTIAFPLGGKQTVVRRPNMGEFRKLRESLMAANDEVQRIGRAMQPEAERLGDAIVSVQVDDADEADRERLEALVQEDRALAAKHQENVEDIYLGWFDAAIEMLTGTKPDPEPWMAQNRFLESMVRHWQTVPLARGDLPTAVVAPAISPPR